jgi:hypothetical protein
MTDQDQTGNFDGLFIPRRLAQRPHLEPLHFGLLNRTILLSLTEGSHVSSGVCKTLERRPTEQRHTTDKGDIQCRLLFRSIPSSR